MAFVRHCHCFGNVPQTFIFAVRYLIKASRIFREAFRRALADKSDADGIAFVAGAVGNRQTAANQTPDFVLRLQKIVATQLTRQRHRHLQKATALDRTL
jgi:hypothetical protein